MEKAELMSTLRLLHEDLARADKVDRQTLEHLQVLMDDIVELASRSQEADADDVQSLGERWRTLLVKFEADHPHLADAINRVSTGLANLGI
ncbi:MAG: DUF4404 family protein [Burkholderiales bacterium]|nr:DUF4404 family protein [Burkholderiales bacterium]